MLFRSGAGVAWEDVALVDIVLGAGGGAVGSGVVMVLLLIDILFLTYELQQRISVSLLTGKRSSDNITECKVVWR